MRGGRGGGRWRIDQDRLFVHGLLFEVITQNEINAQAS